MSGRNVVPSTARYVAGFLFYGEDILLIRKAKPEWQRGKLNGIGGHVEEGENFRSAMVREFKEETGIDVDSWEHMASLHGETIESASNGPGRPFIVEFFRAEIPLSEPRPIPIEEEGAGQPLEWHHVRTATAAVLPNLRWLIPMAFAPHRADWPLLIVEQKGDERAVFIAAADYHSVKR